MEPKTRVAKVINKADKAPTVRHGTVERVDGDTLQVLIDNTASPITCARACVCVQGDRVVVVGKDAIATVGANYGSGGSGSIATTANILKGDNQGNAIAATPGTDYMAPVTLAPVATSGDYNDLDNLPTIPAAPVQSDWDEADTTSLAYIENKPALATVATSGSYNDLTDKPTIPASPVQSDWTEADTSSLAYIDNKPTLATVATSGSYADLTTKLTMTDSEVDAAVELGFPYSITTLTAGLTLDKNEAFEGDTVTVTVSAKGTVYAYANDSSFANSGIIERNATWSFTMPGANVNIDFQAAPR